MTSLLVQPNAMVAPAEWPPQEPLALNLNYEMDPFQKHAVLGIHAGDHVFVTAKTGSGKTLVGEYLIARALAAGKRVFYTTPIKSLSNQKYHDLKKRFPEASVGILTGDIKMQPDAQIIVMTAEILRNLLFKRGTATEGVGLTAAVTLQGVAGVVMDEVHYIQDPDRGHVWEESLILCASEPAIQLVLLSATMPSSAQLASWLAELHQRRVWLLSTTYRIVPLVHGILHNNEVASFLNPTGQWTDAYNDWLKARTQRAKDAATHKQAVANRRADGYSTAPPAAKTKVEDPVHALRRTVRWLEQHKSLPALFFIFSRKECERLAGLVEGSLLDSSDAATAEHILNFHLSRWRSTLEIYPQYHKIKGLLLRGIAFHHSGLMPLLKEAVEILFTRGFVKALFATETFSVGLNMPTKTVVFLELRKYTDEGQQRLLRPDEYIQMAGRAGRRGIDTQGLVLYEPFREPVANSDLRILLTGSLPPLESRMRFHYDFLLKTKLSSNISLAEKSYWAVQQKQTRTSLGWEISRMEKSLLDLESTDRTVCEEGKRLEAAVQNTTNAARKKAILALNRWKEEHSGPRWDSAMKQYDIWFDLHQEYARLVAQANAWDSSPLLCLDPLEQSLTKWGFLENGILTQLGTTATEVNEGHAILMPLLAESGKMADLSAENIVCVLACFIQESSEEAPSLSDIPLDAEAVKILYWLDERSHSMQCDEDKCRVVAPSKFWNLSSLWVSIASEWLSGKNLSQLASAYEMFEGNLQRGLLRLANLLDEWSAIATVRRDLAMLEKMNGFSLLRDEIIVDSLYLRI